MFAFVKKLIGTRGLLLLACITFALVALLYFLVPPIAVVITIAAIYSLSLGSFIFFQLNSYNHLTKAQKNTDDVRQETKSYNEIMSKTSDEKKIILQDLASLNQQSINIEQRFIVRETLSGCINPIDVSFNQGACVDQHSNSSAPRFFSDYSISKSIAFNNRESVQRQEILEQLYILLCSYPLLDSARSNDPNYLKTAKNELIEHHLKVLAIQSLCFDEFDKAHHRFEKNLKLIDLEPPAS